MVNCGAFLIALSSNARQKIPHAHFSSGSYRMRQAAAPRVKPAPFILLLKIGTNFKSGQ